MCSTRVLPSHLSFLQQLSYYKGILDERSELRRLQSELQTTKDNAEATRQYHLTTITHLEDKLKVSFAAQIAIENHEANGPSASGFPFCRSFTSIGLALKDNWALILGLRSHLKC